MIGVILGALIAATPAQGDTLRWRVHSAYADPLPVYGSGGRQLEHLINDVAAGQFRAILYQPDILFPAGSYFDAVSRGAIEAGWGSAAFQAGRFPAAAFFAAVPFGPDVREYLAWMRMGGGRQLRDKVYAPAGVQGFVCGAVPATAGAWFSREIAGIDDFKGLRVQAVGLPAQVLAKLGAIPRTLADSDVYAAMEDKRIDGALASLLSVDEKRAYGKVAPHLYHPPWHRPAALLELIVNREKYRSLPKAARALLQEACGALTLWLPHEAETAGQAALERLRKAKVTLHPWPPALIAAQRAAWLAIADEISAGDDTFAAVWQSYRDFRRRYQAWRALGHVE